MAAITVNALSRRLNFRTGVGIEIAASDLHVVVARVRPNSVRVSGAFRIERWQDRPAAEWGAEYRERIKRCGAGHVAATAVLPRKDATVRVLSLPGVSDKDLPAAIGYELDGLHPFADERIAFDFGRLGRSANILLAITREETLNGFTTLIEEAGLRLASLTLSAPVIYSALRLRREPLAEGVLTAVELEGGASARQELEVYGESPSKPVFSSTFEWNPERVPALAAADLRLDPAPPLQDLSALLPKPRSAPPEFTEQAPRYALAYAAALSSACLWPPLKLNLLPPALRVYTSRWAYAPTAALLLILAGTASAIPVVRHREEQRYLEMIRQEAARLEKQLKRLDSLDSQTRENLKRIAFLDDCRAATTRDLELLRTLTEALEPPAWLRQLELTRGEVVLQGEAPNADGLLKVLDGTGVLTGSEFTNPLSRMGGKDTFRIRSRRK